MKPYVLLLALLLPLLTTACYEKGTDAEDNTNPYFSQAEKLITDNNYNGAIEQYEKALQANPAVAKAYVEMGNLYSEKLGDPVSAIYCYQKYLKARPNADNKDEINSAIEKAKNDFAMTLPPPPPANQAAPAPTSQPASPSTAATAPSGRLQVAGTTQGSGMNMSVSVPAANPMTQPAAAPSSNAAATADTATAPGGAKTYTIQKGDSLWKIARKFYPEDINGGIEKIKQANPQVAANEKALKLGATLVIP